MGEDLPLGVYRDWKRWCRFPRYFFDDPAMTHVAAQFAQVTTPITAKRARGDRPHGLLPATGRAFVARGAGVAWGARGRAVRFRPFGVTVRGFVLTTQALPFASTPPAFSRLMRGPDGECLSRGRTVGYVAGRGVAPAAVRAAGVRARISAGAARA